VDKKIFSYELAGRPISFETGELAKQANASILVRYGDTVVLVTATASKEPREGVDFFPLRVDVEERLYAAGRIPGGFFRREGRPTDEATLAARLIDRAIRPLFPDGFRNDVQSVATILSFDADNPSDIAAMLGASLSLGISDIPFDGPVGAVIMGMIDGELVVNPTTEQTKKSDMHLTVAGTKEAILMVEAGSNEIPEDQMLEAILKAHEVIKEQVAWQEEIIAAIGQEKMEVILYEVDKDLEAKVRELATENMVAAINTLEKLEREEKVSAVKKQVLEELAQEYPENAKDIKNILDKIEKEEVRRGIIEKQLRPDGRKINEIRPITTSVGILPRVHGSGLFTRGQTQALTITALGALGDRQILDSLTHYEDLKRYMHHYNFPPYSTGEVRPMRSPGRREIGHGALAERALLPVIPDESEFPYTIRLVSEILESNGSSSMASVCGSTLSLMDAGVPIKAPVAGIAMGLVKEGNEVVVLTDIQGLEDHLGDMDFKVAGTSKGITALQMDIKIDGVNREILTQALAQAREARLFILEKMAETISVPRTELSTYAPKIVTMQINPDKIRDVIGPGGKVITKIIAETGVKIDIEDDGTVYIASKDQDNINRAINWITDLTAEVEVGKTYLGKVSRVTNFGAFVEILPGKDGLCHISQLDLERVNKVEDIVKLGDKILVKVTEIDNMGRVNLSRKEVLKAEPDRVVEEVRQ